MYGYTEPQPTESNQKKKIIIVSIVMGVIILALIGVLIDAIVRKNRIASEATSRTNEVAVVDDSKNEPSASAEEGKAEPVSEEAVEVVTPSSDVKEDVPSTATSVPSTAVAIPETGASGVLGLALVAGSATTYAFSKRK